VIDGDAVIHELVLPAPAVDAAPRRHPRIAFGPQLALDGRLAGPPGSEQEAIRVEEHDGALPQEPLRQVRRYIRFMQYVRGDSAIDSGPREPFAPPGTTNRA
jgi:hypothetical protein